MTSTTTSASSSNIGKKPRWYYTDEEILHLPSRKTGMDAGSELRCRREAAQFIYDIAELLNHNMPENRGQINHNCVCIAMVHMHRFYVVHPITLFPPKDMAAACLFMTGKSEECPRKLEHIVEVWFKLKYRKAEMQPPFNDNVRKNGAELIVYLEQILLQTIGFDLHVALPHPIVIFNMDKLNLDNKKLSRCAYWFATDIIQLTNWCIRYNERTIACVCIYIACSWADYEIPETAGTPWFKDIDPDMSEELLNKLVDEFTRVYEKCAGCSHARRFIEKAKNGNPSTMPAKSIAQLPPPPAPPVLQQIRSEQGIKKEPLSAAIDGQQQQQKLAGQRSAIVDGTTLEQQQQQRVVRKRSPPIGQQQPSAATKKFIVASNKSATNSRVGTSDNKNPLPSVPFQAQQKQQQIIAGDQPTKMLPQIKQEVVAESSPTAASSILPDKKPIDESTIGAQKKKIGLSEYKQRLKQIKTEPSDSPASQHPTPGATPNVNILKMEEPQQQQQQRSSTPSSSSLAPAMADVERQKMKRQSFMPDLSNASSSIGAEALALPIGIPLVEEKKKKEKDQQMRKKSVDQLKERSKESTQIGKSSNIVLNHHRSHHGSLSHSQQQLNSKERSQHQYGQSQQHTRERSDGKHHHHHRSSSGSGSSHHQNHHHRKEGGGGSTKIYLNGLPPSSSINTPFSAQHMEQQKQRKHCDGDHHQLAQQQRPRIVYQMKEVKQQQQEKQQTEMPTNFAARGGKPPLPPPSPNGNVHHHPEPPPPPPPPENELEDGELI